MNFKYGLTDRESEVLIALLNLNLPNGKLGKTTRSSLCSILKMKAPQVSTIITSLSNKGALITNYGLRLSNELTPIVDSGECNIMITIKLID